MRKLKIWSDPQHGGKSTGCIHGGIVEKNWVLEFARDWLRPTLEGFSVDQELARETDERIDYADRAEAAAAWGADVALLHHVNALVHPPGHKLAGLPNPALHGLITFHLAGDIVGEKMGRTIRRCAPEALRPKRPRRGAYPASPDSSHWTNRAWQCLRHYGERGVAAVLIEYAFATHPGDRRILTEESHRMAICAAAAAGVARAHELIP